MDNKQGALPELDTAVAWPGTVVGLAASARFGGCGLVKLADIRPRTELRPEEVPAGRYTRQVT